jgi:hypothetical protein
VIIVVPWGSPTSEWFKLWGKSPKEAAMTRSKFAIKASLLAGGIGLSMAGFAGSQPAAAQSYSCPAGFVYETTDGCTLPGATYDADGAYGTYGSYAPYDYGDYGYVPYGGYYSYNGGHREFGHGFGHTGIGAEGTIAHHGMGFRGIGVAHVGSNGFADRGVNVAHLGRGGFAHGMGVAHVGGFGHTGGGFGGFHGGGGFGGGGHR